MGDRGNQGGRKPNLQRRDMLCGLCAISLHPPALTLAASREEGASDPPRENDFLVFAYGEREGNPIAVDDLTPEDKQVFAFPMDPVTEVIRNGTRLNQVLVKRMDPDTLSKETAARAVEGVVAYSGVCTHTGCDLTDWNDEFNRLQCPCHESQFDLADSARVVGGPAPWQLAALPLREDGGILLVAGRFEGRVGFPQPGAGGLTPFGI